MGYRWFDKQNLAPMFAFGYGLSYSSFAYSRPRVTGTTDGGLDVSFTVRNTGRLVGDEVPQVYLGPPEQPTGDAQFAIRALAAFDRISIAPGQSRNVTLHVPLRRLQYWSASQSQWVTASGKRRVYIGASSRDVRLTADTPLTR
jgi:beta-glucosidase